MIHLIRRHIFNMSALCCGAVVCSHVLALALVLVLVLMLVLVLVVRLRISTRRPAGHTSPRGPAHNA